VVDAPDGGQKERMSEEPSAANDDVIQMKISELRQAHKDLDAAVLALENQAVVDQLLIARLKKQKLNLRDRIAQLEDQLTPDIIA
jgi:hypothetical protein